MAQRRKDIYSNMVTDSPFGGFGRVDREREIVLSPKRSENPPKRKPKRKPKKARVMEEKSAQESALRQKSLQRVFEQKIADLDDDVLDVLFPEGDNEAIDKFVSNLDEKWIFEGVTSVLRRALGRRRRGRKTATGVTTKSVKSKGPCWPGYVQVGMKKGKGGKMVPNCVPAANTKSAKKPLRDPKGGLTAAGRAHFRRTEGANLKPGVKGAADTPEKMRRKGSFLTRFFTNPSGPMVGENGKPTRLALSAAAWGEPVPKNRSDAAKLAAKGRRLLERYENTKKKKKK